ncbi:hypothetical protein MKX03_014778 [Papaver bracteatum]|nr:hypothetical protein MKX03_014778 [Papaver bracteatum]
MDKSFTPEEKKKRSYIRKKDKIQKKKKGLMESEFSAAATEKEQKRRYRKKENKEKSLLDSGFTTSWGCKKTRYNSNESPIDFSSIPLLESVVADEDDQDDDTEYLPISDSMFL